MAHAPRSTSPLSGENPSYAAVLRNRHFLRLWLAQVFSQIADNLLYFVLLVEVYRHTESNAAVSGLVIAFTLPAVTIGLLAGVIVDRTDRRQVLWQTNAVRAILCLLYIPLGKYFVTVFILSLLVSTVRQFFMPAEAATIPRLVKADLLLPANSLFSLTLNASFIVGMAGAGPLIKIAGSVSVYIVAAILFAVATVLTTLLPPDPVNAQTNLPQSMGARSRLVLIELTEGWQFLRRQGEMFRVLLQLAFAWSLSGIIAALAPGYAATVLGLDEEDAYVLVVPAALGVIVGALLVGRFGGGVRRPLLIAVGLLGMGSAVVLLAMYRRVIEVIVNYVPTPLEYHPGGISGFLIVVMLVAAMLGLGNATVVVPANTVMQEETPPAFRGRVYAVVNSLSSLGSTAPVLIIGVMADVLGVRELMIIIGVGILIVGGVSLWTSRRPTAPAHAGR